MARTARLSKPDAALIAMYLCAIVTANLAVAAFGQVALIVTALVLIPFDLVARDVLHERWSGRGLVVRMACLVLTGSVLAAALNASASRVALASFAAFSIAALVDSVVYSLASRRSRLVRMNASNACGAVADSIIFPLIAFEAVSPSLSATQAALKIAGGFAWSILLSKVYR